MNMQTSNRLEGIGEYYFSQKLREIEQLNKAGKQIINLGIGSPDLAPHPDVIKVLQETSAADNVHAYQSYKGSPVLRNAISEFYKKWYDVSIDPDTEVLPLIGSKEGIMHICMTYLNAGDQALIPNPGYPTYSSAVKLSGGEPSLRSENLILAAGERLSALAVAHRLRSMGMNAHPVGAEDIGLKLKGAGRASQIDIEASSQSLKRGNLIGIPILTCGLFLVIK